MFKSSFKNICRRLHKINHGDLRSIIEHLRAFSEVQKSLISEVIKLLKLILVLPATNATSECVFSMFRLVKSYYDQPRDKIV